MPQLLTPQTILNILPSRNY